jgi:hypothetical protein
MMDRLDEIPWKHLTHAYGSAEDVPDLLRALRTASPDDASDETSPLWCLFGNIWHQGTVYEATSYAVPFLFELAEDVQTPDRVGILGLLGAIASGYSDEREWAAKAHNAVADGFDVLVGIAHDDSDARLAAAYVLAQLQERVTAVGPLLRRLLEAETASSRRAGLVLLHGHVGDRSDAALSVLSHAANSADTAQRRAAAVSLARLRPNPLPPGAREAVIDAISDDSFEFTDLPWDGAGELAVYSADLRACLDARDLDAVANSLTSEVESGTATEAQVSALIDMLFPGPEADPHPQLTASDLSPIQKRAVVAMAKAMERGKRIFYGHFPQWGLPDTMREWRNLAAGRPPTVVDMTVPLLARPENPGEPLRPDTLTPGSRIRHRHFGLGVVKKVAIDETWTELTVLFDEEGTIGLSVPSDGSLD